MARTALERPVLPVGDENFIAVRNSSFPVWFWQACRTTFDVILVVRRSMGGAFQCRDELVLEDPALRHQLTVLRRHDDRPRLRRSDRLLWVFLRAGWSRWAKTLVIIQPQTVVSWHRTGFRMFWRWKSRHPDGKDAFDVQRIALGRLSAGGSQKGRIEIEVDCGHVADRSGRDAARPDGDEGFPDAALVIAALFPRSGSCEVAVPPLSEVKTISVFSSRPSS